MIGTVKEKFSESVRVLTAVYNGFSCESGNEKGVLYASDSRNCDCADGRLRCGLGDDLFTNCSGGWYYPTETFTPLRIFLKPHKEEGAEAATFRLGITTVANTLYEYDKAETAFKRFLEFAVGIRPVVAIGETDDKKVSVYTSAGVWWYGRRIFAAHITAGCHFADRNFYAAKPYRIYFSAAGESTVFDESANESGWLDLTENGGDVVALVEHGDELYAFREFGVLRLKACGKASEFRVETLPYCCGVIYGDSVVSCGDKVFFLAADGLWTFDGAAFKKTRLGTRIRPHSTVPNFRAAYACGKYILQYADENGENKSLVVAGDGENAYFAFFRNALSGSFGYALSYNGNGIRYATKSGNLPYGEKYYFKTQCDLGETGRKTLRSLTVVGNGTVDVGVFNGEREERFALDLSRGEQTVRVDMKGGEFALSFELTAGSEIRQVKAVAYAL